jgi:hypothetical protein
VVEWKTIRGLVWPHAFFSVQIRSIYPDTWFWHFNEYQLHKKGAVRWNCVHDSGKEDPNRKSCRIPTGLLVLIGSAFSSATFLSRKKFTCSKVEAIVLGYRISLIKYNKKARSFVLLSHHALNFSFCYFTTATNSISKWFSLVFIYSGLRPPTHVQILFKAEYTSSFLKELTALLPFTFVPRFSFIQREYHKENYVIIFWNWHLNKFDSSEAHIDQEQGSPPLGHTCLSNLKRHENFKTWSK